MSRDLDAMCALLDKERDNLLSGDLSAVLDLGPRKLKLTERLEQSGGPLSAAGVARMQRKAERNAGLLRAANEGMASARRRIDAILQGVAIRTYGADGRRTEIPAPYKGTERRA